MILVIAEKPSVGAAIGKVLGASSRKDGYLEGNNYIVSWCVGHLVGLADASSYDERCLRTQAPTMSALPNGGTAISPSSRMNGCLKSRRTSRSSSKCCATSCAISV